MSWDWQSMRSVRRLAPKVRNAAATAASAWLCYPPSDPIDGGVAGRDCSGRRLSGPTCSDVVLTPHWA